MVYNDTANFVEYAYNAWGEILTSTGTMAEINPLRYRGYYYDTETGFYYLQSRYYDPVTHRFINADNSASTGQGMIGHNMFAYCKNNPVVYTDYSGEKAVIIHFGKSRTFYWLNYEITAAYLVVGDVGDTGSVSITMGDLEQGLTISGEFLEGPVNFSISGEFSATESISVEYSSNLADNVRIGAAICGDALVFTLLVTDAENDCTHQVSVSVRTRKKAESPLKSKARAPYHSFNTSHIKKADGALLIVIGVVAVGIIAKRCLATTEQYVKE